MRQRAGKKGGAQQRPPGIRDIAETLGVSIGTVDRALHNRPGINRQTRTRILEQAKALGYRPNLAARFLSSQKQLRIGVNLPAEIASFFDLVRDGVLEAVRGVETSDVRLVHRSYPGLGEGEEEALGEALQDEHPGALGGDEALASPIERSAGPLGGVIPCAQGAKGTERRPDRWGDRGFRATRQDIIRFPRLDPAQCLGERDRAAGAGSYRGVGWPAQAEVNAHSRRCHVGDEHGKQEGTDPWGTVAAQPVVFLI